MDKNQNDERLILDEYEIQHFGFSSSYFLSEFKNAVNYTIKSIYTEMEDCIGRKLDLSGQEKEILHAEIITLIDRYSQETEKCLKKHEENIRQYFLIPKHILLENDKLQNEYTNTNVQDLLEEIEQLKRQYLKEKSLSFLYEEEIKHIDRTSQLQEQISELLKKIDNKIPTFIDSITQFNKLYNLYTNVLQRFDECESENTVSRNLKLHFVDK